MIVAAVISIILCVSWIVTTPSLELTMTTKPLYFPEAPIWHIALYVGGIAFMAYTIFGIVDRWLNQKLYKESAKAE